MQSAVSGLPACWALPSTLFSLFTGTIHDIRQGNGCAYMRELAGEVPPDVRL